MRSMRRDCGRSRRSTPATSRGRASGRSTRCECRFRTTPTSRQPRPAARLHRQPSLTAVFAGKYSLSAGAQLHHDEIAQVFGSDAADASITNLRFENLDRTEQYFAAANIPLQLTKWWTLNANLTGICRRDRITADAPLRTTWAAFANAATTFTLPRKFFIEAEYYAMSRFRQANLDMKSYHSVTLSLKNACWTTV